MTLEKRVFKKWLELKQTLQQGENSLFPHVDIHRLNQQYREYERLQEEHFKAKGDYFNPVVYSETQLARMGWKKR